MNAKDTRSGAALIDIFRIMSFFGLWRVSKPALFQAVKSKLGHGAYTLEL